MKRLVPLALVAALALPAFAQAPKWSKFTAPSDGFSVMMPATPTTTTQTTQGVSTHIYIAAAAPYVSVASKTSLPAGTTPANIATMVRAMRGSMMQSAGATETGTVKKSYDGLVGEQTTFKTRVGGTGMTWIASTPRAVYSLTMAGKKALSPVDAQRFFGSFRRK